VVLLGPMPILKRSKTLTAMRPMVPAASYRPMAPQRISIRTSA
jgi:hypothetical protein